MRVMSVHQLPRVARLAKLTAVVEVTQSDFPSRRREAHVAAAMER